MIVYIYTFPNGKKYVGQTAYSIEHRAREGEGYKNSPAVYNAIKKYGWTNIIIEIFPCSSEQEMNELEQYYIKLYNTTNNSYGYNLTMGGDGAIKYDREQVVALWNQGLGISQIAQQIGCIRTTVTDILKAKKLYNEEEVNKRKIERITNTSGVKLKEYYSTPEHQQERKENGLKGAKKRSKPIIVFRDKECTQLVGIYESGRQCAKALNIDHSLPSYALTHNHYSSGYYFYFLDDKSGAECTWESVFHEA